MWSIFPVSLNGLLVGSILTPLYARRVAVMSDNRKAVIPLLHKDPGCTTVTEPNPEGRV